MAISKEAALAAMSTNLKESESTPKAAVKAQTKERWERSLYMKQLALELVCPVINAKKEFIKEIEKECEQDGELQPQIYIRWALEQADAELEFVEAIFLKEEEDEEEEDEEEEDEEEEDEEEGEDEE